MCLQKFKSRYSINQNTIGFARVMRCLGAILRREPLEGRDLLALGETDAETGVVSEIMSEGLADPVTLAVGGSTPLPTKAIPRRELLIRHRPFESAG